jgi:arginyl-tRNA synthetase
MFSFGMVSGTEGAFSTRKGNMVKLRDVLTRRLRQDLTTSSARRVPILRIKRTVARQVGVGALVWNSLLQRPHQGRRVRLGRGAQFRRRNRSVRAV